MCVSRAAELTVEGAPSSSCRRSRLAHAMVWLLHLVESGLSPIMIHPSNTSWLGWKSWQTQGAYKNIKCCPQ